MKILFIGGDKRTLEIIRILKKSYQDIDIIGYNTLGLDTIHINDINIKDYDVIILPVDGIKEDYTVTCYFNEGSLNLEGMNFETKEGTLIFTGIKTSRLDDLFGDNYIRLMDFDDIAIENSIPTAEGVIANIIQNTDYTIDGANIVVLGYGRCGKTLAQKLAGLGANVSVGIIREKNDDFLIQNEIKVFYTNHDMKENIENSDIIINTVPILLLDEYALNAVKEGTYIIDIASSPYGVDFESAKRKGINAVLLPGIPGKIAPITAGEILAKKIESIIKGGK